MARTNLLVDQQDQRCLEAMSITPIERGVTETHKETP